MKRRQIVGVIGAASIAIGLIIPVWQGVIPFSDVSAAIAYTMIAGIVGVVYWGFRGEIDKFFHTKSLDFFGELDPRFGHLTIHYSRKKDNPKTKNPARPRYVTNNKTNQAYWVSTLIDSNRHAINWHAHNGAEELRRRLIESGFSINERDGTPEELGLSPDA